MQGFENVLKMMGIDPQKMLADAQGVLTTFQANMAERDRALADTINAGFAAIQDTLAEQNKAIKKLDPDYVPEEFKAGDYVVVGEAAPLALTNPDHPNGGPVDPNTLDPDSLAAAGMEPAAGAATLDDVVALTPAQKAAATRAANKAAREGGA